MSFPTSFYEVIPSAWKSMWEPSDFQEVDRMILPLYHLTVPTTTTSSTDSSTSTVTPPLSRVFRALEFMSPDMVRVVLLGQDPYPSAGAADGLAFSSPTSIGPQPSLRTIFAAIENEFKIQPFKGNSDLSRWAQQNVLLLNTALTTMVGEPGAHVSLWEPIVKKLVDQLVTHHQYVLGTPLVWMCWGAKASFMLPKSIDRDFHYVLEEVHPAAAYHSSKDSSTGNGGRGVDGGGRGRSSWNSTGEDHKRNRFTWCGHFTCCNLFLIDHQYPPISWM